MVHEGVVLGRVEHLEQRARGIALERDAELVHLVQQEDRVLGARLLHPLDDPARHGADVGAAVAPDVGLVARAAERDADVLPSHRAGDRLGHRGLAHARRAHEEQDRTLGPLVRVAGSRHVARRHRCGRHRRVGGLARLDLLLPLRLRLGVLAPLRLRVLLLLPKLAHGQELEHAVLHVAEGVVVLVEDSLTPRPGRGAPRCARSRGAPRCSRGRSG